MYLKIFVGLTLVYQTMEKDESSQGSTRHLRQDEHKMNSHDANTHNNSTSETECLRTHNITYKLKAVSIREQRKRNLSELYYDSSSKIVRKEQRDVNLEREKKGKRTDGTEAGNRKQNLLQQLLKKDKDGDTILHLSIVHHDVKRSKTVIEIMSGESLDVVNKLQQTPLHLSILTCQPILVEFLIFHGASVNTRDRNGQTALHLASKNADSECVKAIKHATESPRYSSHIVDEKPDLNLKNFEGKAAFHLAALSGSQDIVKTLLDMKADINIQDGTCGRTALHLTVESHNINMITFLLKNGANVNATTFSGNTALHLASGLGMDQLVHLLIRNGANINITNIEGDAPLYAKIVTNAQWRPPRKSQMKTMQQTTNPACSSRTTNKNAKLVSQSATLTSRVKL
ncbi:NF-kappa-B inhibitor alpha-like [Paramuricea clavata]|uniref:NF-kappa-B inhibitor alpha-like n=1 Tax=Paramuricea clavata TaxID=317549 RepID=A0A6S7I5E7_PARCT|nr:NF-kappa-B inhibitor alpha-like [Paramuricea clavata]